VCRRGNGEREGEGRWEGKGEGRGRGCYYVWLERKERVWRGRGRVRELEGLGGVAIGKLKVERSRGRPKREEGRY
jgi:hypothetical protein